MQQCGRRARGYWLRRVALLGVSVLALASEAPAAEPEADLAELDIEDLFDLEVTSLSKKAQRFTEAPAAMFVISTEDIRRSGMRTIPELLRLVPGVQVSRLSGNRWAISARGFASLFSDKLLVLIDGRSVYTPLFAGVYWDTVDTAIEDIDRIEVIRGPGGTLWGANAVNGVINIVTKSAEQTQGALVSGGGGNVDRFVTTRYGGKVGENLSYRIYGKYTNNDAFKDADGIDAHDETDQGRGGFRLDWTPGEATQLTVEGDFYDGNSDATVDGDFGLFPGGLTETTTRVRGSHVLARYSHAFSEGHDAAVQVYYDYTEREDAVWDEWRHTVDLDLQHRFQAPFDSEFVWGFGYRYTTDDVDEGLATFDPDSRDESLYTAFLQGELPLFDEMLRITAGTKAEHNVHTGFEFQPSVRTAFAPNDKHTVWASFTRAVRVPARHNDDLQINQVGGIPLPDAVRGSTGSDSEKVLAFEGGYRIQPFEQVSFDFAAFYNKYDSLQTLEVNQLAPVPDIVFDNKMEGESWGVEVYGSWRPLDWWKLQAWYAYVQLDLDLDGDSLAQPLIPLGSEQIERGAPDHTVQLRSTMDLPFETELDLAYWWVDEVDALDVDAYSRFDVRLGWKPISSVELAFVGQNLTDEGHVEWGTEFAYQASRVPRTFYGTLTWSY